MIPILNNHFGRETNAIAQIVVWDFTLYIKPPYKCRNHINITLHYRKRKPLKPLRLISLIGNFQTSLEGIS